MVKLFKYFSYFMLVNVDCWILRDLVDYIMVDFIDYVEYFVRSNDLFYIYEKVFCKDECFLDFIFNIYDKLFIIWY